MRKIFIILATPLLLASCGGGKSARQLAEEVCDCSAKANDLPASDPNRSRAQNDCTVKQREAWEKVMKDNEKSKEFNAMLSKCAEEQIKKSFGK